MKQPEALRLADRLMHGNPTWTRREAAAELRRLHEANQTMLSALKRIADPRNTHFAGDAQVVARAAIDKGGAQ